MHTINTYIVVEIELNSILLFIFFFCLFHQSIWYFCENNNIKMCVGIFLRLNVDILELMVFIMILILTDSLSRFGFNFSPFPGSGLAFSLRPFWSQFHLKMKKKRKKKKKNNNWAYTLEDHAYEMLNNANIAMSCCCVLLLTHGIELNSIECIIVSLLFFLFLFLNWIGKKVETCLNKNPIIYWNQHQKRIRYEIETKTTPRWEKYLIMKCSRQGDFSLCCIWVA